MKGNMEILAKKLRELALQGAVQRYGIEVPKEVSDRINMEFSVFESQDVLKELRFLLKISNWAKSNGITMYPLGKFPSSLVLYCLGIAQFDPIEHDFEFEDFYTEDRNNLYICLELDSISCSKLIKYILKHRQGLFPCFYNCTGLTKFTNCKSLSPVSLSLLNPSSLDIISLCLKELQIYRGISLDLNTIPLNDRQALDLFLNPTFKIPICWSEAMRSRLSAIENYIFTDIVTARMNPEYRKSKVYEMCWTLQCYHHAYLMTYYPDEYRKATELAEKMKVRNTISFEYELTLK